MTHETTSHELTVGGMSKANIDHELFESGNWGEVWLDRYEAAIGDINARQKEAVESVNSLLQMYGLPLEAGAWAQHVRAISTTGYSSSENPDELPRLLEIIKTKGMTPGECIDDMLWRDFNIESEPEDGNGLVQLHFETPAGQQFMIYAEGYYWMERYYRDAAGEPADLSRLTEYEIDRHEESGAISYDSNEIFGHLTFKARPVSGQSAG
ncbi:MAG: hypothetical protein QFB87_03055 [Patescibacteria group bacterium]|nr:hypothetical protein [Patescibacteria group bacterium]